MKVQEAKQKLKTARRKANVLRKEIKELRQLIKEKGSDPDEPKLDIIERNKAMFIEWKDGKSYQEIAADYKLTSSTVGDICRKLNRILTTQKFHSKFLAYKSLVKYL
jgi:DNA-binding CsgD family transcriptional regulator